MSTGVGGWIIVRIIIGEMVTPRMPFRKKHQALDHAIAPDNLASAERKLAKKIAGISPESLVNGI
jgi:hypothetical protein